MVGLNVNLDKAILFSIIGAVAAVCAVVMLKTSIEQIINGNPQVRYARAKGILLFLISSSLLAVGIAIILNAEKIVKILNSKAFLSYIPFLG